MRVIRAVLSILLFTLLGFAPASAGTGPRLDAAKAHRGIAVLSSSIGQDISAEEIETFVRECRIDLVVVDYAWITYHFPRTDAKAVEDLAQRLGRNGVVVAAMYRPRLLSPSEAQIHLARGDEGGVARDHNDLCFAWNDSVDWGASWGEQILAGCPSISHVVLYNVRTPCTCEKCRNGTGTKLGAEFVRTCRERWTKVRPGVQVGHVGVGLEYAEHLDFLCPFLAVNRDDAAKPIDTKRLANDSVKLREATGGRPFVPLAKVCWESATTNTTEDVAATVRACDAQKLGFLLWTYEWVFHSDDRRYDAEALVKALGGDPAKLSRFLTPPKSPPPTGSGPSTPDAGKTGSSRNDGRHWVFFDSRETATGPQLVVTTAAGEKTIASDGDAGLISYLAERNWGFLPTLGLNLADTNRVLVRFPLDGVKGVKRAELRLHQHPSKTPPADPFEIAVHGLGAAWNERAVTWKDQPAFAKEPAVKQTLAPGEGEVRIDVTALVKVWTGGGKHPNNGLLLKIARAVPEGTAPLQTADQRQAENLMQRALAQWTWASSVADALEKARVSKRPVLAVVTASFPNRDVTPHEELLFSTVLSHPAVVEFVAAHFVPVRVSFTPWGFVGESTGELDTLRSLGTSIVKAKAPALVVARAGGTHVATLESIGTFDHGLVQRFLAEALAKADGSKVADDEDLDASLGRVDAAIAADVPRAAALRVERGVLLMRLGRLDEAVRALEAALPGGGERASEAAYWLAAILAKRGDDARSKEFLEGVVRGRPDAPFALKAAMRLAWPERVGANEALVAPPSSPPRGAAEERIVPLAIESLLRDQRPDGSWVGSDTGASLYSPGVTVLAAHALLRWHEEFDGETKARMIAALGRADSWLEANVARAPAGELNSFAAGYFVDYMLDRMEGKRASRDDVSTAVRQLLGGQCANGAWAYDKRFGEGWKGGFGGWPRTEKGRTHSVNTGLALAVLARAKAAGFDVDASAVEGGVKALQAMRTKLGSYTYTWPEPRCFEPEDASIARAPLCEQALLRLGKSTKDNVRKTLDVFLSLRKDLLDVAKISEGWNPPHSYSSYFVHFGYYHAASALHDLGDAAAQRDLVKLRDDLLACAEPDGTWVDDLAIGKPYGTSAALLTLRLAGTTLRK